MKTILKSLGLILLLVFLFFLESVIYLLIFGTGAQAGANLDDWGVKLIMYLIPILIVAFLAWKMFRKGST